MPGTSPDDQIETGDEAPNFELFSDESEPWRLSDHLDRPVVLLFFPGAFTRVCTAELTTVSDTLDSFGDAHVVGISTDAPPVLSEYRSENDIGLPLLSDHSANVSRTYGAKYDNNFGPMDFDRISKRAAFVIDRQGIVRYAEVLEDAGNEPDYEAIRQTVGSLQEREEHV